MKAFLDDTAQIIGATFEFDQVVRGRSDREKEIGQFVLDKAKLVYDNAKKIGGVKFLPGLEARLMRVVYLKKYSSNEEGEDKAVTGENTQNLEGISEEELELRQELVDYGNKLVKKDLVQGTWGNLSVRLDDEYMLVTPSGIDYARLTPGDMVKVKIDDLSYDESGLKPTSEKVLHAAIYKNRADICGIIHTHSTYCSVFAAAVKPLIPEDEKGLEVFGNYVDIADYGTPGSKALGENTMKALGDNFGAIMAHHGMVTCGKSLKRAFKNAVILEESAKDYLDKR